MIRLRPLRYLALAPLLALCGAALAAEAPPPGAQTAQSVDTIAYDKATYRGTPWATGGAGEGARQQMMSDLSDYNLRLEFAVQDGNYLGDIAVTIRKSDGTPVIRAFSSGPWLMAKLPAGTYDVRASGFGETFDETVQVPASGMESVVFNNWTKAGVDQATPGPYY